MTSRPSIYAFWFWSSGKLSAHQAAGVMPSQATWAGFHESLWRSLCLEDWRFGQQYLWHLRALVEIVYIPPGQ